MAIDVHAHYVPPTIIDVLADRARDFGIDLMEVEPACHCIHFDYGVQVRPFFPRLIEESSARVEAMGAMGVQRQVLSIWADVFGYGLPLDQCRAWHGLLNDKLAEFCQAEPDHFSFLASGPLADGAAAARELERGVRELGAVGSMVAANIEGLNLGDAELDEFWAAAVALEVPVFIHPTAPMSVPRTMRYSLSQIVQYTYDTTLTVGSLMFTGVLDRFPTLRLILSHGGGTVPYLMGRFDCMHERMDRDAMGDVAELAPSAYMERFWYDTILHDPGALRYLADLVGTGRLVLGSDDPFPPMDHSPLASLAAAGFNGAEIDRITEQNPRDLFRLPAAG